MYNPTSEISVDFRQFAKERTERYESHLINGEPDYSFKMDYTLRKHIDAIPGAKKILLALANYGTAEAIKKYNLYSVRVSAKQFPKIYQMTKECCETLGIGMPTVYVVNSPGEMNASTYCSDQDNPIIIIYSSLIERVTDAELKSVIAHECGHIHNNHGIYGVVQNMFLNNSYQAAILALGSLAAVTYKLVINSLMMALDTWSRAAEVTCDRAAVICCGEAESTMSVHAKLSSGGMLNYDDVNIDEFIKQYDDIRDSAVRFRELLADHPISVKRVIVAKDFVENSEIYYKWHPEQLDPSRTLLGRREMDFRTNEIINVYRKEG